MPETILSRRDSFPHIREGYTYLNHAAVSPLSHQVTDAVTQFLNVRSSGPIQDFELWDSLLEETRNQVRQLIHAPSADQIAFLLNTSEGISTVAQGLEWNEGDEIILNEMEFPSNIHPYRLLEDKGVQLNFLKTDDNRITPGQIERAITPATRLVSISAVQFLCGYRADLKTIGELCNQHDVWLVVDGIQALGAIDIDVQETGIDALAAGGQKWLMSPMGMGFLYLSENLLKALKPVKAGWLSVEDPWDLTNVNQKWDQTACRYELGTTNFMGLAGLNASLSTFLDVGIETVESRIFELTGYLVESLESLDVCKIATPAEPSERAGIITFSLPGNIDCDQFLNRLKKDKIIVSNRAGNVRVSPHYYNTMEEVDHFLEILNTQL